MPHVRLGLDVFSLRSQGLSALGVLDFCAARGIEVVHGVLRDEARAALEHYRARGGVIYNA